MATGGERNSKQCSDDNEIFSARMKAQCEEIEAYRLHVMHSERRTLTLEQAAQEWIARYAKSFSTDWRNR